MFSRSSSLHCKSIGIYPWMWIDIICTRLSLGKIFDFPWETSNLWRGEFVVSFWPPFRQIAKQANKFLIFGSISMSSSSVQFEKEEITWRNYMGSVTVMRWPQRPQMCRTEGVTNIGRDGHPSASKLPKFRTYSRKFLGSQGGICCMFFRVVLQSDDDESGNQDSSVQATQRRGVR